MNPPSRRLNAIAALIAAAGLSPWCAAQCYWEQAGGASAPGPRTGASMCFDPIRSRIVLFGGGGNGFSPTDTWEWDGATWVRRATGGHANTYRAHMCFDPITQKVLLYAGGIGANPGDDTWLWDGQAWALAAATGPGASTYTAIALDPTRGRIALLRTPPGSAASMYEWDGVAWTLRGTGGPTPGSYRMATDTLRSRIVAVGGPFNQLETWEWDGTAWAFRTASTPPARYSYAMTFAESVGRTVFFGGSPLSSIGDSLRDVWEWDGATWTMKSNAEPYDLEGPAMAYDPIRRRVTTYGWYHYVSGVGQTWEYNPEATQQGLIFSALPPSETTLSVGATLQLSANATGSGTLSYQWRRYSVPLVDNGRISGATTPSLLISAITLSDAGVYDAVVSDACGPVYTNTVLARINGPCYANCDGSNYPPMLTGNDFQCFLNEFAGGYAYANCDGSTMPPVLNANDFQCFLIAFATGCT